MTSLLLDPAPASAGLASLTGLHASIDALQMLSTEVDPDTAVAELDRAIRRLESVKLRVVAAADQTSVAARTGLADTGSWLARRTNAGSARAAADVRLATALDRPGPGASRPCADALAQGDLSTEHARVIVQATQQLPTGLAPEAVTAVEASLVEKASRLSPDQLRRVARRALATVEPDEKVVDRHEDALLRDQEAQALARTRLTWHDNGDGTVAGHFVVPSVAAAILTKTIQAMTSPRRAHLGASSAQAGEPDARRDWAHQSGLAFVELLEHLPTDRLHGKVAATVVVTLDHAHLVEALGAATTDCGDDLSAGQARRLACNAGILPAVLGGASLPLDLGRANRLFTEAQRVALGLTQRTCAADGCDRPYSWTEIHHLRPWSAGGPTDLSNAIGLCGFHHRRIHDPSYEHHLGPDGVTFRDRTTSPPGRGLIPSGDAEEHG